VDIAFLDLLDDDAIVAGGTQDDFSGVSGPLDLLQDS
jgi:hypothetical protein